MMTDIHTHTVYGVDDGSHSFEMSCAMIRKAAEQGVSHLVCTSHISPGLQPFPMDLYEEHLYRMMDWTAEQKLDIKLYGGSEIFYTESTPELLRNGFVPTLGGTWNVLVEFNPSVPYQILCKALRDIGNEGFSVVVAHAERYECLRQGDRLAEVKNEYMSRIQMNCNTVLHTRGWRGDRWARKMLNEGLIDVVASDAHNLDSRACRMAEAYEQLSQDYDEEYAKRVCCTNPLKLLQFPDGSQQ